MPIYDYIVVGGGISGLYMTYKLSQTGKSILLVESTNRLGGRILTSKELKTWIMSIFLGITSVITQI